MNPVLLVPRREGNPRRELLWEFCREWWEQTGWRIVEGHHDGGLFNRSAAVNTAARAAGDWDLALIVDADIVLDVAQARHAATRAKETGRLTLAYDRYLALNQAMTAKVLDGYDGNWTAGTQLKMTTHVSSCIAVPRPLWERVGGFDERFEGWGWEDASFAAACRTLGGGIDRTPGDVFHLWHPDSPERAKTPMMKAGELLARRYQRTVTPPEMAAIADEARDPNGILIVVITDGRRDCIERCIPSAEKHLKGPVTRRIISDDSGDLDYQAWLRVRFPGWETTGPRKRTGFAGAVDRAWTVALESGQRWVFHLEDDFTFDRDVDLAAMTTVLDGCPHLAQIALRRQAWFPNELAVGGVVELNPDGYTDHDDHLEHREFFTTNPCLLDRRFIAAHPWPVTPNSESRFARQLFRDPDARSAYWGGRTDEPWVTHEGKRSGKGY